VTTNPFQPPKTSEGATPAPRRPAWAWWLVVAGPLLAIGGVVAPVVAFVAAFNSVAGARGGGRAEMLADKISGATLLTVVAVPVALFGVAMTIAGILLLVLRPKSPGGDGTPP